MAVGWFERALAKLGRLVHRRAGVMLAVLLASLLPAGWLAMRLSVRSSFLDLLPDDEPPVRQLRTVLEHARSSSDVVVAISTRDRALAERFARALVEALEAEPTVHGTAGWVDVRWLQERQLLFAEEEELRATIERARDAIDRETLRASGLFVDFEDGAEAPTELLREVERSERRLGQDEWVVTRDGRYLAIWAFFTGPSGDLGFAERAWARVRAIVDGLRDGERFPRDLEIRYAGGIPSRVEDARVLVSDLQLAGAVGFVSVVLLIVAALRAPRALVLLSVPLFGGLLWTFAIARIAVGHLNIISGFLFSILSGLGIEYGIHLLHRYRALREQGLPLARAIEDLVTSTGRALLSGCLTNASVFAVIAAARFRGFSEFGLIAAMGLLVTLALTLLGLPALLVLGERIRPMRFAGRGAGIGAPIRVPVAVRWGVLVLVPGIAVASSIALARGEVVFDGNWRLLAGQSEATHFGDYLRHQLAGTFDAALLWVPDAGRLADVERTIAEVRAEHEARGLPFDVVDVRTLDDVYPPLDLQARRAALARELGAQLDRIDPNRLEPEARARLERGRRIVAASVPFAVSELPSALVGPFLTRDGRGTIVHLLARERDDADTGALVAWAAQARAISAALERRGIVAPMLSENWVAGEIFERIARDGRFLLVGTLLVVLLVLLVDFRRPFAALAVLGSVLLGVAGIAGAMWCTGVRLNFMNAAILPVCVGISLDNAIHVFHRWREGGPGSIPMVLRHTTAANALASATNLVGFGALALTHHEGLRSVAWLAGIGVLMTYLSTTVWFPMLLETIDAWRAGRDADGLGPAAQPGIPQSG